jgi:hypothetical protein
MSQSDRRPTSGRGQSDYPNKLDAYMKNSRSKTVGRNMRTFARTKTSRLVTAWDSVNYLVNLGHYFKCIADATGDVDLNTLGDPGLLALLDIAWEMFYENANLKDLDTDEEASWKLYFCVALTIAVEIQIQYNYRCMLPSFTESDTATDIAYFNQSSFDIFLASMKDYPIPKGVWEIVDIFCTWGIQMSKEYEQFSINIPGCYVLPFTNKYDLADLEAMRDLLRANQGNMLTHAKKFGLKLGKWRDPKKPIWKDFTDVDVIAFFNHAHVYLYDDGTDGDVLFYPNGGFAGANKTTNYTYVEFKFKQDPNESQIHVLAPFFGTYDGTNNPYGGIIHPDASLVSTHGSPFKCVSQHGTSFTNLSYDDAAGQIARQIIMFYKAVIDNVAEDGKFNLGLFGTSVSGGSIGYDDCWPLDVVNMLFTGSGRGYTETVNDLITWIGRKIV